MAKRLITAALVTAAVLFAVGAEAAKHGKMMRVEVMKSQEATMENGSKATVYIVKMNGHTMVAIPEEGIPDALHQQLFTVDQR